MLKTHIDKAKVFVTARFKNEGSVLRETVQAQGLGVETRCEISRSGLLRDPNHSSTHRGEKPVPAERRGVRPAVLPKEIGEARKDLAT